MILAEIIYLFASGYWLSLFLQVCNAKMNLSDEVDLEDYVSRPDKISAADVSCLRIILNIH